MKTVNNIVIPDQLIKQIEDSKLEVNEVIINALYKYFQFNAPIMQLQNWQNHIEQKIRDLQIQLDEHRRKDTKDLSCEFDRDFNARLSGKASNLDLPVYNSVKQELITPTIEKKISELKIKSTMESPSIEIIF